MKRALLVLVVASSCLDFQRRVDRCFDGGACTAAPDAGLDDDGGPGFVPFDAGFFCLEAFCWESPFPHGVTLNTVAADGDDLVVAGEHGLLAERRGGRWASLQSTMPLTTEWQVLWGTSRDDVWLTGDARAWHRTASGWSQVGQPFMSANCQGVTGTDAGVFMSAGPDVYRLERADTWSRVDTVPNSDVLRLTANFESVYGSARLSNENGAGQVRQFPTGPAWAFDAGATFSLVPTSNGLLATGSRTVLLDSTLQLVRELPVVLVTAIEANGQLLGATYDQLGLVDDRALRPERNVIGVRAMAAGSSVVAVGERGLMLERRDGGWVDPTPTVTRSDVVAFVERSGSLFALTADCELLAREATQWTKRPLLSDRCFDVATDGTSFFVLTASRVVTFDAALSVVDFAALGPGLEVRRLWRSEAGALVVTTATDVFVRRPGGLFEPIRALGGGGAWGVAGRGSVARVCGLAQDKVADLDLGRSPPVVTEVAGLLAHECRAVLPLRNGQWALAARGGASVPRVRLVGSEGAPTDVVLDLPEAFIEALAETPKGIAVAADRYAFVPFANPQLVRLQQGFGGISALTVWQGRVFAGGAGGSILQAPAP